MIAPVLLGRGWNAMFVSGATLLTEADIIEGRVRIQATQTS
jgi:hypothetical protein